MKSLLQEIVLFKQYGKCLPKRLYVPYKQYLKECILKEFTIENLADILEDMFDKDEITTNTATINVIDKLKKSMAQTKYERVHGNVVKNSRTHLETIKGNYCNKVEFLQNFPKEDFKKFNKEDLAVEDCIEVALNRFLEIFNEDGWLISKADTLD